MRSAHAKLDALIRSALDGQLAEREADQLAQLLREDDEAVARYLTLMETDALLEEELTGEDSSATPIATIDPEPAPVIAKIDGDGSFWKTAGVAAAMLGAAAIVYIIASMLASTPPAEPDAPALPVVAVLLEQRSAIWEQGDPINSGEDVTNATRGLSSGRVEFQTRTGVNVRIAGPARFTPVSANVTRLDAGRMIARVPEGAEGYTVHAPGGLRIVDLGTEFAIDVTDDGRTLVYVYDGEVELRIGERVVSMTAGEAKTFDAATGEIVEREAPNEQFADLRPYRLDLVNGDFETGDLTGWTAHTTHATSGVDSVIVPLGGTHELEVPPDGVFEPRVLRLGYKYLPISLRKATDHSVSSNASYTIAVRARAHDVDDATVFHQPFDIIAHVDGVNVVTETVAADGQWRWYLARVDANVLKRFVGKPIEIRTYKPGNKKGDFIWIDAVQLWHGEADLEQIETMNTPTRSEGATP